MRNLFSLIILLLGTLCANRSLAQSLILKSDTLSVPCTSNETVLLPVLVENFSTIAGLQFSLNWDPTRLDYQYCTQFNGSISGAGLDTSAANIALGRMTFSWTQIGGVTLPAGDVLFAVAFKRIGGPAAALSFTDIPTEIIALDPLGDERPVEVAPGIIQPIDLIPPTISCPADVTVAGLGAVPVPGIAPLSVMDNCGLPNVGWQSTGATNVSFPIDPDASNYPFNAGLSTVTYTANDAGGNTQTCSFNVTVESSVTNDSLTLIAVGGNIDCNQTFGIDITAVNFDSIGGLQFSLNWDLTQLQFVSISNQNPALSLSTSNFGTSGTGTGAFTFSWTTSTPGGVSLSNNAVLFTLNFTAVGNSPTTISFGNSPTPMVGLSAATFPPEEIGFITVNGAVVVGDNTEPQLLCPANVSLDAPTGQVNATINNLQPLTLSDNCTSVPSLSYSQTGANNGTGTGNANGVYNAGTTTVTYTALDAAGNTSTCSFTVSINAASALKLYLDTLFIDCQSASTKVQACIKADNFTNIIGLQFGIEWDETVLDFVTIGNQYPGLGLTPNMFFSFGLADQGQLPFFGGNASGWPTIPNGDTLFCITFDVLASATSPISFFGPYDAANTAFQSVPLLTVGAAVSSTADNSAPVITCPTVSPVTAPAGGCETQVNVPLATAVDACSGLESIVSSKTDDLYLVGNTVVTFTATDLAGNSSSCTVDVVVLDNNPPTITCPNSITLPAIGTTCSTPVNWTSPSPFDQCNQVITLSSSIPPNSFFVVGSAIVVYTATDGSGNTATCSFAVTVVDTLSPVVLTCPADITVNPAAGSCDATVNYTSPTFQDECDSNLDIVIEPAGNVFPAGTTNVKFTASDEFDNTAECSFNITVSDALAPQLLNCPLNDTVAVNGSTCFGTVTWSAPQATDNCDTDVELTSTYLSGFDFPVGSTTVLYTATDNNGNTATCEFTVTVLENVPPVINGCPDDILIFLPASKCDTVLNWNEPSASDNCALDVLDASITPGVFGAGTHVVVYTAFDLAGNTAECSFTISVQDKVAPVFNQCPPSQTAASPDNCPVLVPWTFPTATDNCSVLTDSSYSSVYYPDDPFSVGVTNVQIYVEDASGNFDTCSFTVTITGVAPGIVNLPTSNQVYYGCSAIVNWPPVSAIGFCGIVALTSNIEPGDTLSVGTYTVTYTATPQIGQPIMASFIIEVRDTIRPQLNCPTAPIVLNAAGSILSDPTNFIIVTDTIAGCVSVSADFSLPDATDACGNPVVTQLSGPNSGNAFNLGSNTLVFNATDPNNNSKTCTVTVEVMPVTQVNLNASAEVGCAGEIVVLTADSIPGAIYTWSGPQMNYPNTRKITLLSLSSGNAGQYTVFASLNGCVTTRDTVEVYLAREPVAMDDVFTIDPGTKDTIDLFLNDQLSPSFDFTVTELSPSNVAGLVPIGDGKFEYTGANEVVSFFYKVCSRTCPNLCDMATVTIVPRDTDCDFVPNIFTPNGDSENETLKIPCLDGGGFPQNSIVIYNQWGDKVYEASPYSNDDAKAWRGTLNGEAGKDLPDGVYYYIFKPAPNEKGVKGFIEIYR